MTLCMWVKALCGILPFSSCANLVLGPAFLLKIEFEQGDLRNPINFSRSKKWAITALACFSTLLACKSHCSRSRSFVLDNIYWSYIPWHSSSWSSSLERKHLQPRFRFNDGRLELYRVSGNSRPQSLRVGIWYSSSCDGFFQRGSRKATVVLYLSYWGFVNVHCNCIVSTAACHILWTMCWNQPFITWLFYTFP